jgi:asparagine synthase (glutamine-hydrolysing)
MCGICGSVQIRGPARPPLDEHVLRAMTLTMRHRGPSDDGYYIDEGIAIGVRRLSIVDVAGGHQPMTTDDAAIVAAQNGELYNHHTVRRDLESAGHIFRTTCDTEVLPHLYRQVGDSVAEQLNGIFAFVIWDAERRRAILARDRLGIKPLYYADLGDMLLFGSELKALLASGRVPTDLDLEAVDLFLSLGFVPGPRTLLRAVKKLLPGHRLVVDPPNVRIEQYWTYPDHAAVLHRSQDEWQEEFSALLDDAVRSQLMSDVPLGAMLSGGLDSSVVVALMARHMSAPVKTFSVGFSGAYDNELNVAKEVARALGTEHHELELSLDDPVNLEALIWSLDEPIADLSAVGFSALAALTAEHVTVALSGQGADELLAGYDRYRQIQLGDRLTSIPLPLRRAAAVALRHGPARLRRGAAVAAAPDPIAAGISARSEWDESRRLKMARGELRSVSPHLLQDAIAARLDGRASDGVERALVLDGQLSLVDDMLHYFDRTSMAYSLEVRVPYLDHRLVELCSKMPTNLKLRRGATKWLLRSAARGLAPDIVIDRPKVGFFSGAVEHWFGRQLDGAVGELLLDRDARYTDFIAREEVVGLIQDGGSYRKSKLLLSVLMLELWLSTYLPTATSTEVSAAGAAP